MAKETSERADLNGLLLDAVMDGVLAFDRDCRYTDGYELMRSVRALGSGFQEHLVKPVRAATLCTTIAGLLTRARI